MHIVQSVGLFVIAALAEIGGAWLVWQGVREQRGVVFIGQAAHNARHRPNVGSALRARQRHIPPAVVELDRRAQGRLHHRYRSIVGRIGLNKTVIAVARELAGFVWATGQLVARPVAA